MKKNFLILFSILLGLAKIQAIAQTVDFNNYTPIQSSGTLPDEFRTNSYTKYQQKQDEIAKAKTKIEREAKDQYYLENAFALDNILKDGNVLFNDTISAYLTAVMDKILENRETKKNVRVYCIKSTVVNAYTTGEGFVFVTTGLLACVRNEAQLAFILSHEYMHYVYKHSIKGYIETKKVQKGKGDYRNLDYDKRYLARKAFSREQESEADLKGFDLYAKSDYSYDDVDTSFQVLKYSYLPFGSVPFKRSFVETNSFKTPDDFWLATFATIDAKAYEDAVNGKVDDKSDNESDDNSSDDEDENSTHPSIDKRLDALHERMDDESKVNKKHFLVSEEAFYFIQKIARFELVRMNLLTQNYERALYNAYNLLQEDPQSKYLKKCIVKALYGIAIYANSGNMSKIHVKQKYAQGPWEQVPTLVQKLGGAGVSVWAVNYIWQIRKEYPNDKELKIICDDVLKSLLKTYAKRKKDFVTSYADTAGLTTRNKKLKPYIRLGLLDLVTNDTEFKSYYDGIYNKIAESKKQKESNENDDLEVEVSDVSKSKKETKKTESTEEEEEDENASFSRIDIQWNDKLATGKTEYIKEGKLVILTPHYYQSEGIEDDQTLLYPESEKGNERLILLLEEVLAKSIPNYEIIVRPTTEEVQQLNDISLLNDWVDERMDHGQLKLISVDYERIQAYATRKGCDNLVSLSISSVLEKSSVSSKVQAVMYSAILIPLAPLFIYIGFRSMHYTNIYAVTFNFKKDKLIDATRQLASVRASKFELKSHLYAYFINLKKI